ncbi:MAG: hypothetical protein KDD94_05910, partial [Calditrichaeota bacterium]|nr:hypothetical protein [Calditrichota bacterium]
MLPNIIAWDEESRHIIYSSIQGEKRKLWSLDSYSELSQPVKFYEGQWFELENINAEQVLIHFWGEGIYLYDTSEQHAQK